MRPIQQGNRRRLPANRSRQKRPESTVLGRDSEASRRVWRGLAGCDEAVRRACRVEWKLVRINLAPPLCLERFPPSVGHILFSEGTNSNTHSDMSQLYAANRNRSGHSDEILEEVRSQKIDIIQGWLFDDQPLAGGPARRS